MNKQTQVQRLRRQRAIMILSSVLLLIGSLYAAEMLAPEPVSVAYRYQRPLLVIDPGHGGIDGGAIAYDGTKESDLNLQISLKLQSLSDFYGVKTLLTRDENSPAQDPQTYSERRDLEQRAEIANQSGSCILFSIHQNTFPTSQPMGVQVLYGQGEESRRLGELTHNRLIKALQPDNRRVAAPAAKTLFLPSHVDCPFILIECGFLSNYSDLQRLCDSRYQNSFAVVLLSSFLQFTRTPTL